MASPAVYTLSLPRKTALKSEAETVSIMAGHLGA
jgi:hypothetical protein